MGTHLGNLEASAITENDVLDSLVSSNEKLVE